MSSALTVMVWTLAVLFGCLTVFAIIVMIHYLMTEVFDENN